MPLYVNRCACWYQWSAVCLVTVGLTCSACGSNGLTAPDAIVANQSGSASLFQDGSATITGSIYEMTVDGIVPISDAVIEVIDESASMQRERSDADGFYTVSIRRGNVAITASRDGYKPKTWRLTLLDDITLNFSLSPF